MRLDQRSAGDRSRGPVSDGCGTVGVWVGSVITFAARGAVTRCAGRPAKLADRCPLQVQAV